MLEAKDTVAGLETRVRTKQETAPDGRPRAGHQDPTRPAPRLSEAWRHRLFLWALLGPTILIVPLLGFDDAGFRLGYGGGYYDRTLAAMQPRPFTVGVGYELGRLPTIYPQPHDIPMDVIVTEAGMTRTEAVHHRPIEDKLDSALEDTFPASDPFTLT